MVRAAVCDLDESRARRLARKYGWGAVYTDFELQWRRLYATIRGEPAREEAAHDPLYNLHRPEFDRLIVAGDPMG